MSTIADILTGSQVGDIVCGITLTRHDIEAFRRITRALTKCKDMAQVKIFMSQNQRALNWIETLTQNAKE